MESGDESADESQRSPKNSIGSGDSTSPHIWGWDSDTGSSQDSDSSVGSAAHPPGTTAGGGEPDEDDGSVSSAFSASSDEESEFELDLPGFSDPSFTQPAAPLPPLSPVDAQLPTQDLEEEEVVEEEEEDDDELEMQGGCEESDESKNVDTHCRQTPPPETFLVGGVCAPCAAGQLVWPCHGLSMVHLLRMCWWVTCMCVCTRV